MLLWLWLTLAALAGNLTVHVLDVGQGDAILIEAPDDKRVLIDAGTAKSGVAELLLQRGIKKLNMVVATHPHADHIGGMVDILKTFDVGLYVDNGMTHTTLTYSRTMQAVEKREVNYRSAVAGRTFKLGSEATLTVLHPRQTPLRGTRSDLNSNSVVLRLVHGNNCFLFTGDAEDPTERDLINRGIEQCDVLKVAHHGSGHSTSDSFLAAVKPQVAIISAGANNRYGHPDPELVGRLQRANVPFHRTDLRGTISLKSDGSVVSVTTEKAAPAQSADATLAEDSTQPAAMPAASLSTRAGAASPASTTTNINAATAAELDQLPGIGPSKAAAIVSYRSQHGPFASCLDLSKVYGIGPKTVAGIVEFCTTEDQTP
ncbi:MAG: helix-hairpin-helix domain-containing protein [Myxococcota bacterium]|nr:helix-hairpin-helix domain-containing protein [Myxococcota bacterium]